jgi:hypothetical protein
MLIALNQRFTHGIVATRRLAACGELPPFEGSALEIWHEAHRLRDAGISFRIEPNYPYDLDEPTTAFGPPDGRLDIGIERCQSPGNENASEMDLREAQTGVLSFTLQGQAELLALLQAPVELTPEQKRLGRLMQGKE